MDPRAPALDMAGLHSTYGYDRSETSKANEMLKTGKGAHGRQRHAKVGGGCV